MQVSAILRHARISPQKCRRVADLVRGQPVGNALAVLAFTPKKGAKIVRKVLESAIANAEHNLEADIDELRVERIEVDAAPVAKRFSVCLKEPVEISDFSFFSLIVLVHLLLLPCMATPRQRV